MPVLVTISAVTYLFKRGSGDEEERASFLAPDVLRNRLAALPEGPTRKIALGIADQVDTLAVAYDAATAAAMSAYSDDVAKWKSSADTLTATLKPMDQTRATTLPDLIELRKRLVDTLTPEEWRQVFD